MLAQVSVRSFGPIDEAEVHPRRLTIFTGPNNSGKSYLAGLLYAIHRANPLQAQSHSTFWSVQEPTQWPMEVAQEATLYQEVLLDASNRGVALPPPPHDLFSTVATLLLRRYGQAVAEAIEVSFGARLSDLARVPRRRRHPFRLVVAGPAGQWTVLLSLAQGSPRIAVRVSSDIAGMLPADAPPAYVRRRGEYIDQFLDWLQDEFLKGLFGGWPRRIHYLPAARSGILQSQRLLMSALIQRASRIGFQEIALPRMAGIAVDFVEALFNIDTRRPGRLADVAAAMESSILSGAVAIENEAPTSPEITYHHGDVQVPVHRASSMVSELAPVVLFIRYLATPGSLLIIEEPEAHLHPATQVVMTQLIGRLAAAGVDVLATTHSDFVISELNNLLLRTKLSGETAGAPPPDQVTSCRFVRDGWESGTRVHESAVSAEEGVGQEEFADVAEAVYSESVDLDRQLHAGR